MSSNGTNKTDMSSDSTKRTDMSSDSTKRTDMSSDVRTSTTSVPVYMKQATSTVRYSFPPSHIQDTVYPN